MFPSSVPSDHLRIQAFGQFSVPKDGKYKFFVGADDAMRMKINGDQVLNEWKLGGYRVETFEK